MYKKPIVLSVMLIAWSLLIMILSTAILVLFKFKSGIELNFLSVFGAAIIIGVTYTGKYKEKIPQDLQLKTSAYYYLILTILGIIFSVFNAPANAKMTLIIGIALFDLVFAASAYFFIGLGSKMKLKELDKKENQENKQV